MDQERSEFSKLGIPDRNAMFSMMDKNLDEVKSWAEEIEKEYAKKRE